VIPFDLEIKLSEYYVNLSFYWLLAGPYFHGAFAFYLLFKKWANEYHTTCVKITILWFILSAFSFLILQENYLMMKSNGIALFFYTPIAILIIFKDIYKNYSNGRGNI
jgi:hypothetical protein